MVMINSYKLLSMIIVVINGYFYGMIIPKSGGVVAWQPQLVKRNVEVSMLALIWGALGNLLNYLESRCIIILESR